MKAFLSTLQKVDSTCTNYELRYTIIGGIAVMYYESARVTQDIDLVILAELGEFKKILDAFSESGFQPMMPDPLKFFEEMFVCPMRDPTNQMKIDIVAALSQFEARSIERSKRVQINSTSVFIATVEDILLYKLFARRPKDIVDAEGLAEKFKDQLDTSYLRSAAKEFADIDRNDILQSIERWL
jgi:hypothetical protein